MFSYDPIAQGIHDYHFKKTDSPIIVHADDFDDDEILPSYHFRSFENMPKIEQKALELTRGTVLDVGACAGCHAIILQEKGFDVYALEHSLLSCQVMTDRKIKNVIHADFFQFKDHKFDTILLLMNGTGIAGKLSNLSSFLEKSKSLLNTGGQILIDSSDLIYLYLDNDDSGMINLNTDHYYGELTFQTEYNGKRGNKFPWLYVDKETLAETANNIGLKVESIFDGDHYDYLAILKHA